MTVLYSQAWEEVKDHIWELGYATLPHMGKKARQLLSKTINRLLQEGLTSYKALVSAGATSNGTLGRIRTKDGQNITLDQLDDLAYSLRLEPWQLLHPDFEVAQFPEESLKIARKMQDIREDFRERAYVMFVQQLDFGNVPQADGASAPDKKQPIQLRRVAR